MTKPLHRIKPTYRDVALKNKHTGYKNDLQIDFNGRCGYCDGPDALLGGKASFQIDHFAPLDKFENLKLVYENLVYSCQICNRGKSNKWPSDNPNVSIENNEGFLHPCLDDFEEHIARCEIGAIVPKSEVGRYIHQTMKLYLKRHQIIWMAEELRSLIQQIKPHIDQSTALKDKYHKLLEYHFDYNELFRDTVDDR
ncbi:MAG: HNH endonuclease [Alphaproteobacteria bacterium]|nr:HNH endonuclease [Alphaproteobacteria bacterium]